MWEVIQANGTWIVLGLFFVLMIGMHGGGMGHGSHADHSKKEAPPAEPPVPVTPGRRSERRDQVGAGSGGSAEHGH